MIKLLAPTLVASVDEGATVILEMSQDVLGAIRTGVEVAFEDEEVIPPGMRDAASQLWRFFVDGEQTP